MAVIGVPDPDMGEGVKAFVQPVEGVDPGPELEAELMTLLRDRIAGFKIPCAAA